ncbi:organic cation transporter protein [Octopus sinensis]|uniref:Organic cation transporter protein n=1 Tax=Octopus sinensis TaxID=2607531 RepID=A0A6P7T0C3_9MOLL|nr:organic cation transporter protein [Octopus sinensis]
MHFDDVLRKLGQFGRYQKLQFLLICFPVMISSWVLFSMVFVITDQQFYCNVPPSNDTFSLNRNISHRSYARMVTKTSNKCSQYLPSDVDQYLKDHDYNISDKMLANANLSTIDCSYGYIYEDPNPRDTVITEFNLVCDKRKFVSNIKAVFLGGRIFGCGLFGQLSDRFGRRFGFFMSLFCVLVTGCLVSLSNNVWMFIVLYFLQGVSQAGIYACGFIIVMEIIGPKYRMMFGFILHCVFSVAAILLAALSYFVRDWHHLVLIISLICLLFVPYWWFLPESVRWLMTRKKFLQVNRIMKRIAKLNKCTLPEEFMTKIKESDVGSTKTYTIVHLINTWTMCKTSLNIWFAWLVNGLLYYGLSINSVNFAGNTYLNFSLSALVEIPAYLLCIPMLSKLGRKRILCFFMFLGGITCIASSLMPPYLHWLKQTLATVGKFGSTAAFGIVYIYSAELFPTTVRNIALGTASIFASIGGAISPYILEFPGPWPLIVLGLVSILSGALSLLLYETKGKAMPDTINESTKYIRSEPCKEEGVKMISKKNEKPNSSSDEQADMT